MTAAMTTTRQSLTMSNEIGNGKHLQLQLLWLECLIFHWLFFPAAGRTSVSPNGWGV